jgi:hypothetical protein
MYSSGQSLRSGWPVYTIGIVLSGVTSSSNEIGGNGSIGSANSVGLNEAKIIHSSSALNLFYIANHSFVLYSILLDGNRLFHI